MTYQYSRYDPSSDKHPGYPEQPDFDPQDAPRQFANLASHYDKAYETMRGEVARWRAIDKVEWERDRVALRLGVLQDKYEDTDQAYISFAVAQEWNGLAARLIELDSEHADLVAEDAIEPSYNFKALEG